MWQGQLAVEPVSGQIVSYLPTKMLLSLRDFSDLGRETSVILSSALWWLVGVCGVVVVAWAWVVGGEVVGDVTRVS